MPRLTANPTAEANLAFDVVKPGKYPMRVVSVDEFEAKSGNTCWKVRLEYADPSAIQTVDGQYARNPGTLIDSSLVVSPAEKQGKVRGFVEACGKVWGDLDSEELIGLEVEVQVKIGKDLDGNPRNEVGRYITKK